MFSSADITLEVELVEGDEMIVVLTTPIGKIHIAGCVSIADRVLRLDGALIHGLSPGALGLHGLHVIGQKLMEEVNEIADEIVIQGGRRTSGRCHGRIPRPIKFPKP